MLVNGDRSIRSNLSRPPGAAREGTCVISPLDRDVKVYRSLFASISVHRVEQ